MFDRSFVPAYLENCGGSSQGLLESADGLRHEPLRGKNRHYVFCPVQWNRRHRTHEVARQSKLPKSVNRYEYVGGIKPGAIRELRIQRAEVLMWRDSIQREPLYRRGQERTDAGGGHPNALNEIRTPEVAQYIRRRRIENWSKSGDPARHGHSAA